MAEEKVTWLRCPDWKTCTKTDCIHYMPHPFKEDVAHPACPKTGDVVACSEPEPKQGQSRQSSVIPLRLPNNVVYTLQRRVAGRGSRHLSIAERLVERVIFDTERRHR